MYPFQVFTVTTVKTNNKVICLHIIYIFQGIKFHNFSKQRLVFIALFICHLIRGRLQCPFQLIEKRLNFLQLLFEHITQYLFRYQIIFHISG